MPVLSNSQILPSTVRAVGCATRTGVRPGAFFDEAHLPLNEAPFLVLSFEADSRRAITRVRFLHVLSDVDAAACLASVSSKYPLGRRGVSWLEPRTKYTEGGEGRGWSSPLTVEFTIAPFSFREMLNTRGS